MHWKWLHRILFFDLFEMCWRRAWSSVGFRRHKFSWCRSYTLLYDCWYVNAPKYGGRHKSLFQLFRKHVQTFLCDNCLFCTLLVAATTFAHASLAVGQHIDGKFVEILQQCHAMTMQKFKFVHLTCVVDQCGLSFIDWGEPFVQHLNNFHYDSLDGTDQN